MRCVVIVLVVMRIRLFSGVMVSVRILIEAFLDDDAAASHVSSAHFRAGLEAMRPALAATPKIVSRKVDGSDWDTMGELQIS